MEIHLLFLLPFLFSAQGSWDKSALHELPSPSRKEVLQWEIMLLTQPLLLLSGPASVNVAACYPRKRDRMHKSKHSGVKEREETQKKPTKSQHGMATLAGKAVCGRAARRLPGSQKASRKYPMYCLHLRGKLLQKHRLFWCFKHIQVSLTKKKSSFMLSMAVQSKVFLECTYIV